MFSYLLKKTLSIFLFLIPLYSCFSQDKEWFALSEFGKNVQLKAADIDLKGNSYTAGSFNGLGRFKGNEKGDTGFTINADEHWEKSFIAKHDSQGKLKYVLTIMGQNSNTNLTEVYSVRSLTNGDLLASVYCSQTFDFTDSKGKTHVLQGGLIRINPEGILIWNKPYTPSFDATPEEDPNGNIFVFIKESRFSSLKPNWIIQLDASGNEKQKISAANMFLLDMKFNKGELWLLLKNQSNLESGKIKLDMNEIGCFSVSFEDTTKVTKRFSLPMEKRFVTYTLVLNKFNGELVTELLAFSRVKSFLVLSKQFNYEDGNSILLKIDQTGKIIKSRQFQGDNINFNLSSGNNGEIYLYKITSLNLYFDETDTIYTTPHNQHISEIFYLKFDSNYKIKQYTKGGGSTLIYNKAFIKPLGQMTYFMASLHDYGTFLKKKESIKLARGYYIFKERNK